MKQAFLSYLAEQITTENQDLRKVCVVLPGIVEPEMPDPITQKSFICLQQPFLLPLQ